MNVSFLTSFYQNDYRLTRTELDADVDIDVFINNVYNDIKDQGFSWSNQLQFQPNLFVKMGYDYNIKKVNFNVNQFDIYEEAITDINFESGRFHNFFTSFDYQQKKFQINGGLRSTYFVEAQELVFSPRINIQYALSNQLKLKISGGVFQQYISQLKEFGENALDLNNQVWILNFEEEEDDDDDKNALIAQKVALGLVYHQKRLAN